MKTLITTALFLFFYTLSYSQVGINTADPTRTLDVNGTLRVRSMVDVDASQATKMVGVDEDGNFIEIQAGQNLQINENVLQSGQGVYTIDRSLDIFDTSTINNINNLVVFPGGPVLGPKIIEIRSTSIITNLTGIAAAPDGTTIILYPTSGALTLLPLNILSDAENRILVDSNLVILQNRTLQLFYDATIQKWIPMR